MEDSERQTKPKTESKWTLIENGETIEDDINWNRMTLYLMYLLYKCSV